MKVEFTGGELTDKEKKIIAAILSSNKRASPHIREVCFNIKEYSKTGLKHKVVIDLKAETDFGRIHADADSWRFNRAVKNVCKKLFKQIMHSTKAKKESMHHRFVRRVKRSVRR